MIIFSHDKRGHPLPISQIKLKSLFSVEVGGMNLGNDCLIHLRISQISMKAVMLKIYFTIFTFVLFVTIQITEATAFQ